MKKNNHAKGKKEKKPEVFKTNIEGDEGNIPDRALMKKILSDKDKASEDYQGGEI